jgi:hypothetical protein
MNRNKSSGKASWSSVSKTVKDDAMSPEEKRTEKAEQVGDT